VTLRDEFANGMGWFARVDGYHQSKMYIDNTNTSWVPSRTLFNGSLGLEQDWWSVRAWVNNIFDRKYVSYPLATFAGSGAGSGVTYSFIAGERRTAGLTLAIKFE
jgi:outer membrane receptor protein involved in Fe transport